MLVWEFGYCPKGSCSSNPAIESAALGSGSSAGSFVISKLLYVYGFTIYWLKSNVPSLNCPKLSLYPDAPVSTSQPSKTFPSSGVSFMSALTVVLRPVVSILTVPICWPPNGSPPSAAVMGPDICCALGPASDCCGDLVSLACPCC